MPSLAEITYFEASEDYKSGLASLDGSLTQISKATGLKQYVSSRQLTDHIITLINPRSYVGYEAEDPAVLFWVNGIRFVASSSGTVVIETSFPSQTGSRKMPAMHLSRRLITLE
jgi:hypothetical protein